MQPVTGLLVRGPERIGDPLVGNGREFLDSPRQRAARVLGRADDHYVSEGRVGLAQRLQVAGLRPAALEDGLALLDPLDGGRGSQEDLLGLEAARARVEDHAAGAG